MKRSLALSLSLGLLALVALNGTSLAQPSGSQPDRAIELKVGLIAPFSGDVGSYGAAVERGVRLAMDEVNSAAAGKVQFSLVVADDKNDPIEGVNAATRLIAQDQVKAIIGAVTSVVSVPVSSVAQEEGVVQISPTSTNPAVTVDKDFVFRACFIDPDQAAAMAVFASTKLKARTAAVLYQDGLYGSLLAGTFEEAFRQAGGNVASFSYSGSGGDLQSVLSVIAQNPPAVLYLPGFYPQVNTVASQAREAGIRSVFLGSDGWGVGQPDVTAIDGSYFSNHFAADDSRPEVRKWVERYRARYGVAPDAMAALGYDAMALLAEAVERARSDVSSQIRDALASLKNYKGASGRIRGFDEDGDPIKEVIVLQVENGGTSYVDTVSVR